MTDADEYIDIENGNPHRLVAAGDAEDEGSIQIVIPRSDPRHGRHSPVSDISDQVAEEGPFHGVVTEIGATRRGSFKNLDDHAGPVDPLSDGAEDGDKAQKNNVTKIGTVRGTVAKRSILIVCMYILIGYFDHLGILMPCLQSNMIGAILFIRLPWIIGHMGILLSCIIVLLSTVSVLLTLLSLNAIVTNGKMVRSGSLYQVLRKNVGVEIGGSIGLVYVMCKTIMASMYCLGAAETFLHAINEYDNDLFPWGTQIVALSLVLLISISMLGGYSGERSSAFILGVTVVAILSFTIGGIAFAANAYYGDLSSDDRVTTDNIGIHTDRDHTGIKPSFYFLLGLYYPCVGGIMGASTWTGSLKNPGKSIPQGTMGATMITLVVSVLIIFLFGYTVSNDEMLTNKQVLASLSWPISGLGYVCITCACAGAASQCLRGVIRNVGAIAVDGAVPFLDGFNEKRIRNAKTKSIFYAWLAVSIPCLASDLQYLAPIAAILFLIVYSTINASCFLLSVTKSPGFRPHFKYFSWHTALIGVVWCLALMFTISWWIALILLFVAGALIAYVVQSAASAEWGDAVSGLMFNQIRDMLLYITRVEETHRAKNWRPQILVITRLRPRSLHDNQREYDMKVQHENLIRLAGQLKKGKGLTVVAALIQGDSTHVDRSTLLRSQRHIEDFMDTENINGFTKVGVVAEMNSSFEATIQMSGVGALSPNTFMSQWPEHWDRLNNEEKERKLNSYKTVTASKKALIVVKGAGKLPDNNARLNGFIDIYWVVHDGGLLLLIPYLLSLNKVWRGCTLRLFVVLTRVDDNPPEMKRRAEKHLQRVRINAVVETVDLTVSESETHTLYERTMDVSKRNSLLKKMADYNRRKELSTHGSSHGGYDPVAGSQSPGLKLFDLFSAKPDESVDLEADMEFIRSPTMLDLENAEKTAADNKKKSIATHHPVENSHSHDEEADTGIQLKKVKTSLAPPISQDNMVAAIRSDSVVKAKTYNVGEGKMLVAINFNRILRENSKKSKLVVTNLPLVSME